MSIISKIKAVFISYSQDEMDEKQKEIDKYKKLYQQLKNKEDSIIQRENVVKEDEIGIKEYRKMMFGEVKNQQEKLQKDLKKIQGISDREVLLNQKEQEIDAKTASHEQFKLECMDRVYEADKSAKNCAHALKKLRFKYSELKKRSLVSVRPTPQ